MSMSVSFAGASLRAPSAIVRECLAGIITSLALIPEVISFSVVAGVDPKVSLVASVVLGLVMSLLGGRPAMVTAAAGSVALVIGPTVKAYGVAYVLPIVLLAGVIQIVFGAAGLARLARHIPRSVMTGFVNALGILIFFAQVPHVLVPSPAVYALFVVTVIVVYFLPRYTKAVPSPLVAIVAVTLIAVLGPLKVPTVSGDGGMTGGLPGVTQWLVPLDLKTLQIVWPAALSVAFVGLLESLLTAQLVDEMTATPSNKSRESWALGVANICAGFYGGIAGCAMIGQTVVNVEIGRARTRLSTIVTALVLLLLVTALSQVMAQIPMVALAAVMMVVALKTISWQSVRPSAVKTTPIAETCVMLLTVAFTVWTGNLAVGVAAGVLLNLALKLVRIEPRDTGVYGELSGDAE
jgi:SulP family sulfate permease